MAVFSHLIRTPALQSTTSNKSLFIAADGVMPKMCRSTTQIKQLIRFDALTNIANRPPVFYQALIPILGQLKHFLCQGKIGYILNKPIGGYRLAIYVFNEAVNFDGLTSSFLMIL